MYSTPAKRSAPTPTDARPTKRQATSSPEEGELDDSTPPPPAAPRSPTPLKASTAKPGGKVPFPFKKKTAGPDAKPEPVQNGGGTKGRGQPSVYVRSAEDERRFREEDERRNLPPRPMRLDSRPPPPRAGDHWSRYDHRAPRWEPPEARYDQDRHYVPRGEPSRWEPRGYRSPSPRAHSRRRLSRSPSSPRSRSPLSPASTGKEKHRLPPPRSPVQSYYDDRDSGRRRRDSRTRDSNRSSRPTWQTDSYIHDDDYRPHDSRDRRYRDDSRERRYDHDREHMSRGDAYHPVSPRSSPQKPLSPQSLTGSLPPPAQAGPRTSPPQPSASPPPPPGGDLSTLLPTQHSTVRIPLPKKPPTPISLSSNKPFGRPPKFDNEYRHERRESPEKQGSPEKGGSQGRVVVQRQRRKPIQRSREEERSVYGRLFEGCGKQEDYDVITKLGEGTFGEVHKAVHIAKGHTVALKRILMHNEKEGMPVTALREIKILKALHHPCIVEIVDMFVVKSKGKESPLSVYMVFPYMDHDLAGLLENERVKLSPSQIKLYMKQLLEGTEYMHRNHILHRDMKAANLLISNNGSLKIADFGLARAFDPNIVKHGEPREDSRGRERKYTNCVVTRWYRPPELLLGARQYGGEVDMWGIGCVLGEMFWRRPILPGSSDLDQLDKIWQLCGTPNQHTWPNYDTLPGCEGVKRFNMYPRRLKQTYETIGPETCDLLDKLLTCNPRERLTASQALDHDYFWTDPLPADPKTLPTYEASHEFDKRGRRNQAPIGPPVPPHHAESFPRFLPAPTQPRPPPPREAFRSGLPPPTFSSYPPSGPPPRHHLPPPPPSVPQQLPPFTLRPGKPPPMIYHPPPMTAPPISGRPAHLPPRPKAPMGIDGDGPNGHHRREPPSRSHEHRGGGELNYG